jgi:hypothetical protein
LGEVDPALMGLFYRACVIDDYPWFRLPLADKLRLVAFELELTGTPRPLIGAVWEVIDGLSPPTPSMRSPINSGSYRLVLRRIEEGRWTPQD